MFDDRLYRDAANARSGSFKCSKTEGAHHNINAESLPEVFTQIRGKSVGDC